VKKIHTYVSPVFTIYLIIFLGSYVIVASTGGIGPCGSSLLGLPFLVIGFPVGFIGMMVELILSLVKTFRHFKSLPAKKSDQQV
jgi:hypothetical protein